MLRGSDLLGEVFRGVGRRRGGRRTHLTAAGSSAEPLPAFLAEPYMGALVAPQRAQTTASLTPHSGQRSASEGVSCWHRGHFMQRLHLG